MLFVKQDFVKQNMALRAQFQIDLELLQLKHHLIFSFVTFWFC